jgi:orotidine-5'-phosphate decarboxylase
MYEKYGTEGIRVYIETAKYAKEKGMIVIGDVKRGDIASTATAYASHLEGVEIEGEKFDIWHTDAVTLNPYMGFDAIEPFIKPCNDNDKGIFILVKTSNKSGESFQDLKLCVGGFDNSLFFQRVAAYVRDWGKLAMGQNGYSKVGAVLGATASKFSTIGSFGKKMRKMMPNTFFLVPGYGAQGGTGKKVKDFFDKDGRGCIINSSRGIIAAYQQEPKYSDDNFVDAARDAAEIMKDDINGSTQT